MHGKLICGRPLVVRLAGEGEKYLMESANASSKTKTAGVTTGKSNLTGTYSGQTSRSAKIAAIKNKLKAMGEKEEEEEEKESRDSKKPRQH